MKKNFFKKKKKKKASLEDLGMSLLNFNFVMIYIIHEISVLLKNHLNYLQVILECFFKEYNRLFLKQKTYNFFTTYNDKKFKS